MGQQLVQRLFHENAAGFHHVLHHLGIVEHRVAQALKGEHVADFADHRSDADAQRVIPVVGEHRFERRNIRLAPL